MQRTGHYFQSRHARTGSTREKADAIEPRVLQPETENENLKPKTALNGRSLPELPRALAGRIDET